MSETRSTYLCGQRRLAADRMTTCQRILLLFIGIAVCAVSPCSVVQAQSSERFNVLLIMVDDLRPALGCYGDTLAMTPNIDRLASTSRVFRRAYCQQSVCGPSRTSMLTGLLPDNTQVWHNRNLFRQSRPDWITLPQLFKNDGYHSQSFGKVFSGNERELDPVSWSVPEVLRPVGSKNYLLEENSGSGKQAPLEFADVPDNAEILRELQSSLTAWREQTKDPLLNPDHLLRLSEEVRSMKNKRTAKKHHWGYPDYFFGREPVVSKSSKKNKARKAKK